MNKIFGFTESDLLRLGAIHTAREIYQQPNLWTEVIEIIKDNEVQLKKINQKINSLNDIRIVLSGAGTSAYIGDVAETYLKSLLNKRVESIATTDVISNPKEHIEKKTPTILVSFARSGNSPESVGTYDLFDKFCDDITQVVITCNQDGKLAKKALKSDKNIVILMPKESNDKSFAMTSSFTCMLLASLIIFDIDNLENKKEIVNKLVCNGQTILTENWSDIKELANENIERVVYVGSGCLKGLSREAALKNLELTSGKIISVCESILGFRHGPKSIINEKTLVIMFASQNDYTRLYDLDLAKEIFNDKGNHKLWVISNDNSKFFKENSNKLSVIDKGYISEAFVALNYILFAQIFAFMNSIKLGVSPDNPRPDGTVNRVVKGVKIYNF